MEKILIIGGVAAGATAAAKARRISSTAEITILEAGPDVSFANCGLPYFLGGDIPERSSLILQSPESFWEQYRIKVLVNTRAESLDRQKKRVIAKNALNGEVQEFEYTKLILAQGGLPIRPALPGVDHPHVFTLWTLQDMDRIHLFIKEKKPKTAVIAGGGFIGLEMAEALAKRNILVHIVEKLPYAMGIMDPEFAGFIQEELFAHGVSLHTGVGVTGITPEVVETEDGNAIPADMVLLSIGVRPTLALAESAELVIGKAGGLLVDEYLRTSDPDIYAAGDMVEIEHRVHHGKVRIPLAGPANRQGRIAAENALGGKQPYAGAIGTSVVKVFDAIAGMTGLSLKAAKKLGLDAEAVTVHKEHHTAYYPGAEQVSVRLVYDRKTGRILGGETAGYAGADRRLDVVATAVFSGMTIHDLASVDFAYSPPIGTANDALNMTAFAAENRASGFSPSLVAEELDDFVSTRRPAIVDVRDSFAFEKGHIDGAENIPLEFLAEKLSDFPSDASFLIYDDNGKKGHQALRLLLGLGRTDVHYISGGFASVARHARAEKFSAFQVQLPVITQKNTPTPAAKETRPETIYMRIARQNAERRERDAAGPLIIDVRTPKEFAKGAYPGAINIPLDSLPDRIEELGGKDRYITLYCASGARSAYAARLLEERGFTHITNGGGIMQMMRKK
ncbi:MAG: FAD-dependent oxidoreductase [Fibrobacteraceae bacterium]|nr:FAD-dependent oxidoreductase [Fibrobacteraceae bacterium]